VTPIRPEAANTVINVFMRPFTLIGKGSCPNQSDTASSVGTTGSIACSALQRLFQINSPDAKGGAKGAIGQLVILMRVEAGNGQVA
jgi:hypothetical protein